jgi:hypothetical protein
MQQDCVDFVIDRNGELLRVQVRTASWVVSRAGHRTLQCRTTSPNGERTAEPTSMYDLLFIVGDGRLWEIPAQDLTKTTIRLDSTYTEFNGKKWARYRIQ